MKTVTVLNERAKLIHVHDLSEVVAVYRHAMDEAFCFTVIEANEDEEEALQSSQNLDHRRGLL